MHREARILGRKNEPNQQRHLVSFVREGRGHKVNHYSSLSHVFSTDPLLFFLSYFYPIQFFILCNLSEVHVCFVICVLVCVSICVFVYVLVSLLLRSCSCFILFQFYFKILPQFYFNFVPILFQFCLGTNFVWEQILLGGQLAYLPIEKIS